MGRGRKSILRKKTGSPLRETRNSFGYSLLKEIEGRFSFWTRYSNYSYVFISPDLSRAQYSLSVVIGSVNALTNVLNFSDAMILGMAFPNIIGGIILSPQIKATLNEYWARLKSGEMKTYE